MGVLARLIAWIVPMRDEALAEASGARGISRSVRQEPASRLPKTRSAKIVRRAVRAKALGRDPGDLSSVENPEALDEIAPVGSPTA